jgi:CheY-like chemotaxis protein
VLEAAGFEVLEAENGVEALAVLEEHADRVAVVISDLMMPHMGGGELYRALQERHPQIPFIVSSGHVDQDPAERDHLPADVPYVLKPWTAEDIVEKVRGVISGPEGS